MNTFIRLLYAILIAAAVVAFVSIGIYTFYPAPTAPTYPMTPAIASKLGGPNPSDIAQKAYDDANAQFQKDNAVYQRNVSIMASALAVVFVAGGLWVRHRYSDIIGEGLALGGIGNSIYAVTMASIANDRIMRFVAVCVFLAAAILVVYVQFNDKKMPMASAAKSK